MSDKLHLLLPGAVLPGEQGAPPLQPPPSLARLLALLAPAGRIEAGEPPLSTPCEIATAQALGLDHAPGRIPWAALESGLVGQPCAWVKACHWEVGTDHVLLADPDALEIGAEEDQALRAAMAPFFTEDGIALAAGPRPGTWLATGEVFRGLATTSPAVLAGRRLTAARLEAASPQAVVLRRLQNEMQMLLYTHPVNEARQGRGQPAVNSVWFTGAGVLEQPHARTPGVTVEPRLAHARDPQAHAQAWQAVDAGPVAAALAAALAGREVRVTLCGPRAAHTWGPGRAGLLARLGHRFSSPLPDLLASL